MKNKMQLKGAVETNQDASAKKNKDELCKKKYNRNKKIKKNQNMHSYIFNKNTR